jgi:hypothetical protein
VAKTYDAVEVARGLVDSDRPAAERTLAFVRNQGGSLRDEYVLTDLAGRDGQPSLALPAGVARLAVRLGDPSLARGYVDARVLPGLGEFLQAPANDSWYFDASVVLLSLRELQASLSTAAE